MVDFNRQKSIGHISCPMITNTVLQGNQEVCRFKGQFNQKYNDIEIEDEEILDSITEQKDMHDDIVAMLKQYLSHWHAEHRVRKKLWQFEVAVTNEDLETDGFKMYQVSIL